MGSHGTNQLRELVGMVRNQETYLSTTSALYAVAVAVLVFSFYQQEEHFLARTGIALAGLLVGGTWYMIVARTSVCTSHWKAKILALESDLGVPQTFRISGETPNGMPKQRILQLATAAVVAYWAVCLAYAAVNLVADMI